MKLAQKLLANHVRELAARGLTRAQAAAETGLCYNSIVHIALKHDIAFTRQRMEPRPGHRARAQEMRQRYEDGETLEQIGQRYNLTRERVRQIMTKWFGTTSRDGGAAERARRTRRELHKKRDARCHRKWGCSYRQYQQILKHPGQPTYAFARQRINAGKRSIPWELNLLQWWKIWEQSGKWSGRGRGRGYCMCRLNDTGPYSVDNVYIATGAENMQDYWVRRRATTIEERAQ